MVRFFRFTHDTSGDKIKVLEGLNNLLQNPSRFLSGKDMDKEVIENILRVAQGLYQFKRHNFGRFSGEPASAREFKQALEDNQIAAPKNPMTFSAEHLKRLLLENNGDIRNNSAQVYSES